MLIKLKEFFQNEIAFNTSKSTNAQQQYSLEQACALLLMEVSNADFEESSLEKEKIKQVLQSLFNLSDEKLVELFERSKQRHNIDTSIYIND
jgi:uncharacterized tellurite resistance protein B-like protein